MITVTTFVLVPGAWHGAWCWYKVIPRLEAAGCRVIAPDLPSLGRDFTPLGQVTLDLWAESLGRVLEGESEPVVLVGHSRGGIVISEAAERCPRRVQLLVYVAAFLLRDGETLGRTLRADGTSLIPRHLLVSEDGLSTTVREEGLVETFYGESPAEDVALARCLLRPEARAPSRTPVHVTAGRFGRVPRTYVTCLRDRAVPAPLQRRMYTALPCRRVVSLDTDHSPFFSAPDKLVTSLLSPES